VWRRPIANRLQSVPPGGVIKEKSVFLAVAPHRITVGAGVLGIVGVAEARNIGLVLHNSSESLVHLVPAPHMAEQDHGYTQRNVPPGMNPHATQQNGKTYGLHNTFAG